MGERKAAAWASSAHRQEGDLKRVTRTTALPTGKKSREKEEGCGARSWS
jgi:hypothetical protein